MSSSTASPDSVVVALRFPQTLRSRAGAIGGVVIVLGVVAIAIRKREAALPPLPPGQWVLSDTPTVRIGDEPFTEVGFFPPITTLLRTSDTTIATHSPGGVHLRMVSLRGHLIGEVGGLPPKERQPAPGEFERIAWADVSRDTVFFYDDILRRLTAVSPEGDVYAVRSMSRRRPALARAVPIGRLRGGDWVLATPRVDASGRRQTPGHMPKFTRDSLSLLRGAAGDSAPVLLASVAGPAVWHTTRAEGGDAIAQPFGPQTLLAVLGDEIWVGDNAGTVLIALDANGEERRRISLALNPQPLTHDIVAEALTEELSWLPGAPARARVAEMYRTDRLPEHAPYFTSLFVSADSLLWVELWAGRRRDVRRYLVHDRAGQRLAALETPRGFRITDAGANWVLGVYAGVIDEAVIEGVRMYSLRRR